MVERRVGDDVTVRVDSDAESVFGVHTPAGGTGDGNLFQHLQSLSDALKGGQQDVIQQAISALDDDLTRISGATASEGARYNRISQAKDLAGDTQLQLKGALSDVEEVDLAEATIELQTQEVAYQAALAAAGRTIQPSLLDFLR